MLDITAIILTKDEAKNIALCLDSVKGLIKRAVVVDCGSTDGTVEIAKEHGADVYYHPYEYYARQFNWGIDNAGIDTEWIMRLDADERFTPELCAEIERILTSDKHKPGMNGVILEADFYFLGRLMKHGLRNKRKMMLFRRGIGRIEDRRRDAHSIISEGYAVSAKNHFIHYDFKDLETYIRRYVEYTEREALDYLDYVRGEQGNNFVPDPTIQKTRKKKFGIYYKAPRYIRARWWFIYNYIFRLGFLDGREGYIYYNLECQWYRLLVDARIYEMELKQKKEEENHGC